MKASTHIRVGLMGIALLGFTWGMASCGTSNHTMKIDGMKSEGTMEEPVKSEPMESGGM